MKKRGALEGLYMLLMLVMLGVALIFLVSYARDVKKDTLLEKTYFSRDLALTVNAIYASPANLEYKYGPLVIYNVFSAIPSQKLESQILNFNFSEQTVTVREKGGIKSSKYSYADDLYFGNLSESFDKTPEYLFFVNDGLNMGLGLNKSKINLIKWKYPQIDTRNKLWSGVKKIIVRPQGNDLLDFLLAQGQPPFYGGSDEPDIILEINDLPRRAVVVTISYETATRSRKLAALIVNKILENNPDIDVGIIISDSADLEAKEAGVSLAMGKGLIGKQELYGVFKTYYEE